MKLVLLALLCALGPLAASAKEKPTTTYTIPLPPKPDFSALDWLVGEWTGKTTGRSPEAEVRLSVAFDLERRFLILREEVSLAATKTAPASMESWLGILSVGRSDAGFVLRTFSSTGFMARYRVTAQEAEVRFSPEGGDEPPPGWLFRRIIRRPAPGELSETVQAAPPDRPFFDYYTATLTRKTSE